MKISLVTATGERPEAFELCKKYMQRQNYDGEVEWIIVDDGRTPISIENFELPSNWEVSVARPDTLWEPGLITQGRNLLLGTKAAIGDVIFFIEDDDWYSPEYLSMMMMLLADRDLIGEGNALYYNVAWRMHRRMKNLGHASLCQTAIRTKHIHLLHEAIYDCAYWLDIDLWRRAREAQIEVGLFLGCNLCVGIKGLPGRAGIGAGHKPASFDPQGWEPDYEMETLKKWIGSEDLAHYAGCYSEATS